MQLNMFDAGTKFSNFISEGTKICRSCNEEHPLENFYVASRKKNQGTKEDTVSHHSRCKECYNEVYTAIYYAKKTAPPVTESCQCCGTSLVGKKHNLDHDHNTGEFRGWLCPPCNTGIGHLGDDITGIEQALKYLKAHYER